MVFLQKHTNDPCPRQIGDVVLFHPAAFVQGRYEDGFTPTEPLRGRVTHINEPHRFYTVEAECNGSTVRESFKY